MENDGKWWKVGDLYCFVLYCFELFCALYFSLWALWHLKSRDLNCGPCQVRTLVSPPGDIESAETELKSRKTLDKSWKKRPQMVQRGRCSSTDKHWTFQALKVRSQCFSMIYGIISPAKTGVNKNPQGCPKWNSCNSHLSQSVLPLCNEKKQLKAEETPLIFSFFSKKRYEVYWQVI